MRDYRRFGIELLNSRGFQPEVWDVGPLFYTDWDGFGHKTVSLPLLIHQVFKSKDALISSISELKKSDCIISPAVDSDSTNFIFRTIEHMDVPYGFCFLSVEASDIDRIRTRANYLFYHLTTDPKLFIRRVSRKLARIRKNDTKNSSRRRTGPSFLIVAGTSWPKTRSAKRFSVTSPPWKMIGVHNYDYDAKLIDEHRPKKIPNISGDRRYAVFLDQYIPAHFAYYIVENHERSLASGKVDGESAHEIPKLRLCDKEIYYEELNKYFGSYEQRTGLEIVIASHPKAPLKENKQNFRGRQVLPDNVVPLVRDATCVLAHFSTSIGLSVIYRKPLIILYSNSHHRSMRLYTKIYAKHLGCSRICISSKYHIAPGTPTVNDKKYRKYMDELIKVPNSEDRLNWEVFSDFLTDIE